MGKATTTTIITATTTITATKTQLRGESRPCRNYFLSSCSIHRFVRKLFSGIVDMRPRNHLYNSNRHDLNNYFHIRQFHNYNSNRLDLIKECIFRLLRGALEKKYNYKDFNFNPISYGWGGDIAPLTHFIFFKN